jgi:DNA (cytosine-5)-methyltransferase 1
MKIDLYKGDCLDIVVVSLFDGLSGGRLATDRVQHLNVLRYYSSEVDKYAIQVADKNYPQDTPHRLGDVTQIDFEALLADIKSEFPYAKTLLLGGSPCQGFSMAGKLKGSSTACGIDVVEYEQYMDLKAQDFEFNGQSYLFWEYVRAMKILKPDYFMLENVRVTKKWLPMFNEAMGVEPTRINSSLVSAQNRDRYYWHNFGEIPQPEDKGLLLRDILDYSVTDSFPSHRVGKFEETMKDEADVSKNGIIQLNQPSFSQQRVYGIDGKSPTIAAGNLGGGKEPSKIKLERPCELKEFNENSTCHHIADATDIKGNESIKRVYAESGKSPAMTTCQGGHREPKVLVDRDKSYCIDANYFKGGNPKQYFEKCRRQLVFPNNGATYRKLTPLECERLQTLPDGYTDCVSNSQRYKMIGNGWTIDVVAHILRHIPTEDTKVEKGLFD